jgi:hypothetical protein
LVPRQDLVIPAAAPAKEEVGAGLKELVGSMLAPLVGKPA